MTELFTKERAFPIKGRGWLRHEISLSGKQMLEISDDERQEIRDAVARFDPSTPHENISPVTFRLSMLGVRLRQVAHDLEEGPGFVIVRGLNLGEYTPEQIRILYLGLGSYVGTPLSQDNTGRMLSDIVNRGVTLKDVVERGIKQGEFAKFRPYDTGEALEFHSDLCDVFGLLCIEKAKTGGECLVASAWAIHYHLARYEPELLQRLYQPFYYYRQDALRRDGKNYLLSLPVFASHRGFPTTYLIRGYILAAQEMPGTPKLSAEDRRALDRVLELANEPAFHVSISLEPGDVLLVNNHVTYHARTSYEDESDTKRRHLLRLWLSMSNSRPLPPSHAHWYGATAAGALRGGYHPPEV